MKTTFIKKLSNEGKIGKEEVGMQGLRLASVFILSTEEKIILKKISSEITKRGKEAPHLGSALGPATWGSDPDYSYPVFQ